MSFAGATRFLTAQPSFHDTAELYRLPNAGRIIKFMRLFAFEIKGRGPGMTVRKPVGASGGRGRPPAAVDLQPRMPRRGLPAATAITWAPDNPHRGATASYTRYEGYKNTSTVGEARAQGATPQDLKTGLSKGYAQL